jgi:hypothetical protein
VGGVARRATIMETLRRQVGAERVITVGGGFELLSPEGAPASEYYPKRLEELYALLGYDLGLITRIEADWLERNGLTLPPSWHADSSEVTVRLVEKDGAKVAFVFLPLIMNSSEEPEMHQRMLEAVQQVKEQADLLVGVSLMGSLFESRLLQSYPDLFHILLGSGPGKGNVGTQKEPGETLWVRPYYKGAAVSRIDIKNLPGSGEAQGAWSTGRDVESIIVPLYDDVASSTTALELMRNN